MNGENGQTGDVTDTVLTRLLNHPNLAYSLIEKGPKPKIVPSANQVQVRNAYAALEEDGDDDGEAALYSIDEPEFLIIEIALDSGAGDHVISRMDLPGAPVRDSRGSRSGQHFLAAGGQRLPTEGEMALILVDEKTGATVDSVFQVAEVTRPLWSV
ncbi:MAG: hypothetical protein QF739_11765, partial [Acidimicrobiales bacterium]|nr:hypothetical protein [Acidimicrobiales bacterium]